MGKWINTQEQNGEKFTTTSSWNELKISHEQVHSNIQKYINENANHIPQNQLAQKALNIENNTLEVFEKLNNVLKVNCNNSHS